MLPVSNTCGRIFHCEAGQEPANSPEALCKTPRAEQVTECLHGSSRNGKAGMAEPAQHWLDKFFIFFMTGGKGVERITFFPKAQGLCHVDLLWLRSRQCLLHQDSSCCVLPAALTPLLTPWGWLIL